MGTVVNIKENIISTPGVMFWKNMSLLKKKKSYVKGIQ